MEELIVKLLLTWLSLWLIIAFTTFGCNTLVVAISLGIVSAFISSELGKKKKIGVSGSFILGYCFSVLGLAVVLLYPKNEAGWSTKKTLLIVIVLTLIFSAILVVFGSLFGL